MAKKIEGYIKLNIPPAGPTRRRRSDRHWSAWCEHHGILQGVQRSDRLLEKNMPIPVVITVYQDKSFTFTTKTAPVSFFLKKAAGLNKGGQEPGRTVAGKVTEAQVREIAEQKMGDMNAVDVDGAMAMVRGSARAMGLDVVEG